MKRFVLVEGKTYRCVLCNQVIDVPDSSAIAKVYSAIYRHFKERHPEVIDEVKAGIQEVRTKQGTIDSWLA